MKHRQYSKVQGKQAWYKRTSRLLDSMLFVVILMCNTIWYPKLSASPLADAAGDGAASSPPAGAVHSTRSEAALSKARPDLASVCTAGEGTVSVEDSITGLDEGRVARLTVRVVSFKTRDAR